MQQRAGVCGVGVCVVVWLVRQVELVVVDVFIVVVSCEFARVAIDMTVVGVV